MRRVLCPALVASSALLLAACGLDKTLDYEPTASTRVVSAPLAPVTPLDAAGQVDSMDALILPPPEAGAIQRVRERHFVNGTRQEIVLRGDSYGENVVEVSLRTHSGPQGGSGLLQIGPPSERGVRGEIIGRFPNMAMHIVTRPLSNALGPIGVAVGRREDGARCAFAWQWIEDAREVWPGPGGLARMGALFASDAPASIRMRLCRADATADQLVSIIEGVSFGARDALERVMRMDRRAYAAAPGPLAPAVEGQRFGADRLSSDLLPVGRSLDAALGAPAPLARVAASPARVASPPARVAAAPPARKAKPAPPPRKAERARDREQERERVREPSAEPAAPLWGQAQSGPRYMAPVSPGPGAGAGAVAPSPTAVAPRLNPSLPPQAYRGPASSESWRGR